jgi:hypothetical protein
MFTANRNFVTQTISILCLLFAAQSNADNPLVRHIYTADPAPLVYNNRFYIFTGHDEGGSGWTLNGWHVLSSSDMVNWIDHGEVLAVKDVTWLNTKQAWAAQCVERNGKFYFYICDSGEIGVAVADNVLGPYKDALGKPLIANTTPGACPGDDNIDPSVFIDDNGSAYIYWGTDRVNRQAKLKSNMIEIDGSITVPQGTSRFFEASWVHKYNNTYYYSYAAYNADGKDWPSNIDYCTSSNPLGPWTYKGTLNGYAGSGTNHAGIVQFKDKWYFVYHTDYLSGGTAWERSVQVDYLYYNTDGSLKKIVQTTSGVLSIDTASFSENVYYKLKVTHSEKLLDVTNASTATGATLVQMADNGKTSQQWKFTKVDNGVYQIVNKNSGLVLDASTTDNTVVQAANKNTNTQKWKLTGNGKGEFYIVNKQNNRLLEVYYAEMTDGSKVQHWGFNNETCQLWEFVKVDSGIVGIKTLTVNERNYAPGLIKSAPYLSAQKANSDAGYFYNLTGRSNNLNQPNTSGFYIYRSGRELIRSNK